MRQIRYAGENGLKPSSVYKQWEGTRGVRCRAACFSKAARRHGEVVRHAFVEPKRTKNGA